MKVIRRIASVASTLLVIVVVFLAVALAGVRLVGLTPYTVLSGSMEPTYHVGSLIYVKAASPEEIAVGDPITFVVNDDLLVATHRVVEMEVITEVEREVTDEATGKTTTVTETLDEPVYHYRTKGDANEAEDGSFVDYRNVLGKPIFTIPLLGFFSSWIQTRQGMIIGLCGLGVLLILLFLPDMLRKAEEADSKAKPRHRTQAARMAEEERRQKGRKRGEQKADQP